MRRAGLLVGLSAVVLAPIVTLAAAVAVVDANTFKPSLIAAALSATGRALTIDGDVRFSRSLWPTIEADEVKLANLPGGSRPDMVRVERIAVELSIPALLQRRIEISQLILIGPNILFEQVDGQPNWRFDLPAGAPTKSAAPTVSGTPFQLRIRNAQVRNGMVTWHLPSRTKVLGIRTLNVQHKADGGPLQAAGVFVYSDNEPFKLSASATPTGGWAGPWKTRLEFAAFDTTAVATGTMDTAGRYDLQVEARAGAVEQLNALLPEMDLPAVHQATLSTRIGNGEQPGDLPVVGATRLRFIDADVHGRLPGLKLGASDVAIDAPGGTATWTTTGEFSGQAFNLSGTTGVPLHPDQPASVAIDLVLKAVASGGKGGIGSLGLKGRVALRALSFEGLDAIATLATPALAALRPVLAPGLPALTDLHLVGHLALPAKKGSVAISGGKLTSRQGDLEGDATLGLGPNLVVTAKLRAGKLDVDAMLTAFGIDPSPPTLRPGPTGPLISDAPLPWAILRGPTLDVTGAIGALSYLGQTWDGVDVAVQLKGGRLARAALKLAAGGNPVSLSVTADATAQLTPVSLTVDAPALPLALVARTAGLPGRVNGSARVKAELKAAGTSLHDLAGSLNGTVSLAAVGGNLTNAAFIQLTAPSLAALGIKVPPQGDTALRCLGVAATFNKGVGRLAPIALETTYLSLAGTGQIDLGHETLALRLEPLAAISGSRVSVPVVVEGPFRAIEGRLDADGVDKIGMLLNAWFGGDESVACENAGLVPKRPD